MEKPDKYLFDFLKTIISNNNEILLETVNELNKIKTCCKDDFIIKSLDDTLKKLNNISTENKKSFEIIKEDIAKLYKTIDELKINTNLSNKELIFEDGKYIGQVMNGVPEGKGIFYYKNGSRYEGEYNGNGIYYYEHEPFKGNIYDGGWKNDKQDGKGIFYFNDGDVYEGDWKNGGQRGKGIYHYNNGDRYEGDFKNRTMDGKGIYFYNNGQRYEGDFRNGKREGKGVFYFNNGDRSMGDYLDDVPTGIHVFLMRNGIIRAEDN